MVFNQYKKISGRNIIFRIWRQMVHFVCDLVSPHSVRQDTNGSAKSASQRAMRAIVRAMRVTRVMRAMRATVQMLRIFICFIYIRVRKFWTNFFLWFSFFFRFCYNFGENFSYSKSPKMRKKIKTIRKNLLRFKTSGKKNPRKTYGCTATRIGIY